MERQVERYKFRLQWHGESGEVGGRIVIDEGPDFRLQLWLRTSLNANILLDVGPVKKRESIWPLFRALCEYKGVVPLEFRRIELPTGPEPWLPIPGA